MKRFKLSELRETLKNGNTRAKKHYSQNFLIDGNILKKIVDAAEISAGETVLEIGAGTGALTEALLERGAYVIAVEKDPSLVDSLNTLQSTNHNLKIIVGDCLTIPIESLLPLKTKIKIVGNLPYKITAPILSRFLPLHDRVHSLTTMVQKEVAERITASPSTKEYGSFSLFSQFWSCPTLCFKIAPSCFFPAPKVTSAVVQFILTPPPIHFSHQKFFHLTRAAFHQRRKMLKNALSSLYSTKELEKAFASTKLPLNIRGEVLSLSQFLSLFLSLQKPSEQSNGT